MGLMDVFGRVEPQPPVLQADGDDAAGLMVDREWLVRGDVARDGDAVCVDGDAPPGPKTHGG